MKPLATLAFLTASILMAGPAAADLQDDEVTPTGWWWLTDVDTQEIQEKIDEGFRMVDIEIDDYSPLRITAAFVKNSGPYATGWWWYPYKSAQQISNLMAQNNARLIDLEPFSTPWGMRYACLMIPNTGSEAAVDHDFEVGLTSTQLDAWVDQYRSSRRIVDIQPYTLNGQTCFAFIWVANTGALASGWGVWVESSWQGMLDKLDETNSRLIDIEEYGGLYAGVMVPKDGNSWWFALDISFEDAKRFGRQHAARIVDVERTADGKFHLLARRNANDLTVATNNAMLADSTFQASSGLMLREINGPTLAAVNPTRLFEPASTMKTMHLFASLWTCMLGWDSLTNLVNVPVDMTGSCPSWGSGSFTISLKSTLFDMMKASSNPNTEAILKRYSKWWIEAIAHGYGAENVQLNHTIGCAPGPNRNEVTLDDLYAIHAAVVNGDLGAFGDDFYELMINSDDEGFGELATILSDELDSSTLAPFEVQGFRLGTFAAHKGGNYQYSDNGSWTAHRSRAGLIRLPFRNGCTTLKRDYFIGAWVNDHTSKNDATLMISTGYTELFRDRVRAAIASWESSGCTLGDLDGNRHVDLVDLQMLLANFGRCVATPCVGDFNSDGIVDGEDLMIQLDNWG